MIKFRRKLFMEQNMFCFQCEQTAGCTGCTGAKGVCGKTADTARLQDELTGALIGLSHAADENTPLAETTWKLMVEGLFATLTNVSFDDKAIAEITDRIHQEKARLRPDCGGCASPCGHNDDYDMKLLWNAQEDIRSLKSLILFGIRGMAAYAYHAMTLGYTDTEVNEFFAKALFALGEDWDMDLLLPIVMGKQVNTIFPAWSFLTALTLPLTAHQLLLQYLLLWKKGPFIVITGHDLHDLKLLLEQTEGKGINIYTHGEMLPCHAYPELKKYSHLKGNFGTAWQNQQKEFAELPAPVLFTTNCLMPRNQATWTGYLLQELSLSLELFTLMKKKISHSYPACPGAWRISGRPAFYRNQRRNFRYNRLLPWNHSWRCRSGN